MKQLFYTCLISLCFSGLLIAEPLELNAHNLTMLALKHSSDEAIGDYAKGLARSKHIKEYFKYIKNKEKRQELYARVTKELKKELAAFPKNPEFKVNKKVKLYNFNSNRLSFDISGFSRDVVAVFRKNKKNIGLPEYFFLLYSNLELLKVVKVEESLKDKFDEISKSKFAYLQATLQLPAYQNHQEFQVVIKDIVVYADSKKEKILAKKSEKRANDKVIKSWLLADGFTNKLVGIHAFSIFGNRLQDMMSEVVSLAKHCKKTKKIGRHQEVVCKKKYTENTIILGKYIGGKFAQLELVAIKQPSPYEKETIVNKLKIALKQAKQFFSTSQKWQKYGVDFEYNSDSFTKKGTLSSIFSFNKANKHHGVIFKMISKATKQLIEESK